MFSIFTLEYAYICNEIAHCYRLWWKLSLELSPIYLFENARHKIQKWGFPNGTMYRYDTLTSSNLFGIIYFTKISFFFSVSWTPKSLHYSIHKYNTKNQRREENKKNMSTVNL